MELLGGGCLTCKGLDVAVRGRGGYGGFGFAIFLCPVPVLSEGVLLIAALESTIVSGEAGAVGVSDAEANDSGDESRLGTERDSSFLNEFPFAFGNSM